ncbi:hypothetical protein VTJ83DRAFT_6651 [Remersonia thermophila]|uniref:Small ribosomal subunit protein mS33 n=1 Tax=Remersonia thermophila TaxID=72144 RepID=A0ABR4D6U4_9PEZI
MSVPRARLLDLMRARCELFGTTFNPEGLRTGNKILRQRLKGPALASYYPRKLVTLRDFQREFEPLQLEVENEEEQDRLEHIAALKARGKGAPKKKREAGGGDKKKR